MPTYYDSQNQPHELLERIGSGGEGTVYQCADYNFVGKIYHEPVTEEKAEKLRWMAANKNERLLKVSAWVVDILRDVPNGKTIGFLMPNVKAKEIHELYSLKSRRVYFPEATWHFLVNTAANVARAFYNLHRDNHIMGDVNHGNCVVMRDGTVKLIDCDSYSVKTDKMRYRCDVGVATHLAPELQNVNLRAVERENKHDNFGLAVIIFQLLFLGRHPFAGNYLGGEDKSLEDCIRELRFAYGVNARLKNVRQPPGTLQLSAVSPRVAKMFERAFLTENRPEPREWIEALEDLSLNLKQCALHPGHLYFKELENCPWCEIEAQTGLMLFPFITSGAHLDGEKPFNIFTVENLIASFGIERNLPAKPPPAISVLPPPSPEIVEARRARRRMTFFIVPAHFFGLILLMLIFGVGAAFYFGFLSMIISIAFLNSSHKSARQPLEESLIENQRKLDTAEKKQAKPDTPQIISDDLVKIRKKVADYQTIQQKSVGEVKRLEADTTRRELYKFLHSKSIADAQIFGVSEKERKNLTAVGVKTAAEIDENRLRYFYKIGDETIPKLVEWRGLLELEFDKDERANTALAAEQARFINETNGERRRIERDIEQLLILLRGAAVHLHKQQREVFAKSEELVKRISQSQSDLQWLGSNVPATIALIIITIFAPMFGSFTGLNAPPSRNLQTMDSRDYPSAPPPAIDYTKFVAALPRENFTDAQIDVLFDSERLAYGEKYYSEAIKYNYSTVETERAKAERFSRQAIRFVADDTRYLNALGYALYGQGKYDESLEYLNQSLALEKRNTKTKIFIAMNCQATERFKTAAKILKEVVEEYPNSFEGFYNLGLAYNALNDYSGAEKAFQKAVAINTDDAGSHYYLGYALYKLNRLNEVRSQFDTLVTLDENLAQRLWTDAHLDKGKPVDRNEIITVKAPLKIN